MVKSQTLAEREFGSYAMNIRKDKLPAAKKLMREFVDKFIREIEATPGEGQQTYQLNMQFFGLADASGRPTNRK